MKRTIFGYLGFMVITLTGCAPSLPSVNTVQPTVLVVQRDNPLHQPGIQSFSKTIKDVAVIKELYTDLSILKSPPKGPISCPNDNGVSYTLTFKHDNSVVLVAHAQDTGCRMIQLSTGHPKTRWAMGKEGDGFWSLLYSSLGLPSYP